MKLMNRVCYHKKNLIEYEKIREKASSSNVDFELTSYLY